jgi:transposase
MNQVVADYPDREIHVVLDNLKTHKPKRDLWLARHKNVRFHFTPTHASWLNQVEIYLSIVQRKVLTPNDFDDLAAVEERLLAFERHYEEIAQPFEWKFTRTDLDRLLERLDEREPALHLAA